VPLTGGATGTADLSFPGTDFRAASGRVEAQFSGATGRDETARTPLTGDLALSADRGLFQIERANLRTGATNLSAQGRFSFEGGTDLTVNLNSGDASELQAVLLSTGLLPAVEESVKNLGVALAGNLSFDGRLTGDLDNPLVNGRFELGSLTMRGRDLGALSADIVSDAVATRVERGRLSERGGGGAQFSAVIPRAGRDNVSFEATLENANAANLAGALGLGGNSAVAGNLAGLGPASGSISVTGYPGAMSGSADLTVGAGRIGTQPYQEIAARATFSGSKVNLERLDARLSAGLVSASGEVDLETQSFDLRARGEGVQLSALAELAGRRLPQLGGAADFTATAAGNLLDPTSYRAEINAKGRDVTVNGRPAGELTLVGRTTADQKFDVQLTTGLLGQPQTLRAQLDLAGEGLPLTFETSLAGADLTPLFAALLPGSDLRVTGRATGTLRASGGLMDEEGAFTAAALSGRAEFSELTVQIEDVPLTAVSPLVVLFSPREVTFERTQFTGPGTNITFGGTAAVGAGGTQNFTVNGDLNLRVLSNPQSNFFLSGTARVGVRVAGTFEEPSITGTASVANASLALLLADERLTATNINAGVRFNGEQASIESMSGRLGGGRFEVAGGALLDGLRLSQFSLTARGTNVTVPFPQDFRTTADAELQLAGRPNGQVRVGGTVNVRRAEYTEDIDLADLIDQRNEASLAEGGAGGGEGLLAGTTTLELVIQGRDALVVRNNLADIVGSINLRASGPLDDPVISGRITSTRGTLAFRNDRFEIQRAIIDLPPRRDADPVLNILAEAELAGYRISPSITGPLSQPTVSLRSDPALPQADIVALITTGSLATGEQGLSTIAQTGLGTATSLLTESLINAPVRRATDRLFGLNRFEFDPIIAGRGGASPTARLTVGRQINRDLSITYSTNVTGEPNQVFAVVYRVSDRLSFVAQYQQGATDALRTNSNNFNFELRFRKRY
jgi:autotransporter translocation and assembly factor TamB